MAGKAPLEDPSTINGRFVIIMKKEGLNQTKMAEACETAPAYINDIIHKGRQPGFKILTALKKNLPELNFNWVISGEGHMYNELSKSKESEENTQQQAVIPDRGQKIESLLDRSQDTLDRYLTLVEQQQNIIENLSKTLSHVTDPASQQHEFNKQQESEGRDCPRKVTGKVLVRDDAPH